MKYLLVLPVIFLYCVASSQDVSLSLQKTAKVSKTQQLAAWKKLTANTTVSFASGSNRFSRDIPPAIKQPVNTWEVKAWKNEKVHTQVLIYSKNAISNSTVTAGNLQDDKGNVISSANIITGFVQYVITDEFRDGCGYRKPADFDSSEVADVINTGLRSVAIDKNTVQPVWISIQVPTNTVTGKYKGTITVVADKSYVLHVSLDVIDKALPLAQDWSFRLDFWQHPAAIARVHNLTLWSDEHFAKMKEYYTMLANAGQKIITASIVNEPWNHQTFDDYPSLIKWTKKQNGEWSYDYSLFDKYVSFVMSCGITDRINCYSMVPWKIAFTYYDEAQQKETEFTGAIGTPAYNEFWTPMLKDFATHLKDKGWFAITSIAMDERPMEAMKSVISLLKNIDSSWKISLAGDYHPEIEKDIYDYCVAARWTFPDKTLETRKQQGKASTWYTCCVEKYPNLFTFSPPEEAVWIGWYTAATNMDGYLRWAYNSFTKNASTDTRFTAWPAGDTYQVYPGPFTSIRFEKTIEGIQDFEKIKLLRAAYKQSNESAKLTNLEATLKTFTIEKLSAVSAQQMLAKAKALLNE